MQDIITRRHGLFGLALAALVLVADQTIKAWVEAHLPFGTPVPVLPFFSLLYTFNTGIAFSFLDHLNSTMLVAIAAGVILLLLYLWWQARRDGFLTALGYGLIFGGAIGNIIDRASHGHVIDYVYLHAGPYSFAVFNLADAALTIGVGAILLGSLLGAGKQSPTEDQKADGEN